MWGSWGMPMWGFGWLIPLIGFAFCLAFVVVMMRTMSGGRFTCMGGHARGGDEVAELRRQVLELREEVNRRRDRSSLGRNDGLVADSARPSMVVLVSSGEESS